MAFNAAEKFKLRWQRIVFGLQQEGQDRVKAILNPQHLEKWILAVLIFGFAWTLANHLSESKKSETKKVTSVTEESNPDMDSFLPKGHVLFPIEFANQAALDGLIQDFAVLNIYQSEGIQGSRGKLVARNVRVLRPPQNPQTFAAVIPEIQVESLVSGGLLFYGVIQNKQTASPSELAAKPKFAHQRKIQSFESSIPAQTEIQK